MIRRFFKVFLFCFVSVSYAKEVIHLNLDNIQFGGYKSKPYEFTLKPHDMKSVHNDLLWKINVDCEIISDYSDSTLLIKVTNKKGSLKIVSKEGNIIDDEILECGDSREIKLEYHYKIHVSAVSNATVELINEGEKDIVTACGFDWN